MMLRGILSNQVDEVADRCLPLIQRALEATTVDRLYTSEWVLDQCRDRAKQLWVGGDFEFLCVSQIIVYPKCKELDIFLASGTNGKHWIPVMVDTLKAFGKHHGCTMMAAGGRKGWQKWSQRLFTDKGAVTYRIMQEI